MNRCKTGFSENVLSLLTAEGTVVMSTSAPWENQKLTIEPQNDIMILSRKYYICLCGFFCALFDFTLIIYSFIWFVNTKSRKSLFL